MLVIEESGLSLLSRNQNKEVAVGAVERAESAKVVSHAGNDLEMDLVGEGTERHDLNDEDRDL